MTSQTMPSDGEARGSGRGAGARVLALEASAGPPSTARPGGAGAHGACRYGGSADEGARSYLLDKLDYSSAVVTTCRTGLLTLALMLTACLVQPSRDSYYTLYCPAARSHSQRFLLHSCRLNKP